VLAEFEAYHDIKFGTLPTIVKKTAEDFDPLKKPPIGMPAKPPQMQKLPSVKSKDGKTPSADGKINGLEVKGSPDVRTPTTQASQGSQPRLVAPKGLAQNNKLEIEGENVDLTKKPAKDKKKDEEQEDEEYFQQRVLKGIPDFYTNNPELRDLALTLQRDIIIQNPKVKFKDIVGLDDAKRILREAVKLPLIFPHLFTGVVEPWKGALLFGPPGTGKVGESNSRLYLQKQWRQSAEPFSSTSLPPQSSQNGKENPKS
jgi:katanin p60 ATPase-containing subunit A1